MLTVVRLEAQKTDLVLTVNVPHLPGQYVPEQVNVGEGRLGPLLEGAEEIRRVLVGTFEVVEWGLFVN